MENLSVMQDTQHSLERAITAAKRDPHGGKVLLPLEVAEALLAALKQRRQ